MISATNRDLAQMVEARDFRADLYYRLNVFPLTMPPLRERREDIPLLTRYFVQHYALRMNKQIDTIPAKTLDALSQYHWPGNIRELENVIERAIILTQDYTLHVPVTELKLNTPPAPLPDVTLKSAERGLILQTLQKTNWVIGGVTGAAAKLGMKRTSLVYRMQKLDITRPSR
jgi:formate hydrogenlyase transcriptional activator